MKSMIKLWIEAQSYYHPIWWRPLPAKLLAQHYCTKGKRRPHQAFRCAAGVGSWKASAAKFNFCRNAQRCQLCSLAVPLRASWTNTAATPHDHISPPCSSSCLITRTFDRSKQPQNFVCLSVFGTSKHHFEKDWNILTASGLIGRQFKINYFDFRICSIGHDYIWKLWKSNIIKLFNMEQSRLEVSSLISGSQLCAGCIEPKMWMTLIILWQRSIGFAFVATT